jgi:isoquinoline 1-oxidoreductase beta subunit
MESSNAIPTGAWRSVTNPPEAFAHESSLDEFAFATKIDPVELHLQTLTGQAKEVVKLAASKAGWGTPMPAGQGRGIACHSTWGVSPTAEVVEVAVDNSGNVRVLRVVCALNCGMIINPDLVIAQMQGGIIFGLTAALKEHSVIENGRPTKTNFDDYPLLRFDETPSIEVYLVPNVSLPSGIGEMANPPVAPALANAIFAATGKRLRRIPIHPEDVLK